MFLQKQRFNMLTLLKIDLTKYFSNEFTVWNLRKIILTFLYDPEIFKMWS